MIGLIVSNINFINKRCRSLFNHQTMSGHSKWATIKRTKESKDAQRGNIFTKLGNTITVAVKEGGTDPEANFKLRLAIERAKAVNMPKDNIERAIKRGTGELKGAVIEDLTYGALLPGQVAVIIKCLSDNKNRALADIKTAITKNGGQFVDLHSVSWQFENKGVIRINVQGTINPGLVKQGGADREQGDLEMKIIDSGAEDYIKDEDGFTIYTRPEELKAVKEKLENSGVKINSAGLEMVAKDPKDIDNETLAKVAKILGSLDELDEVSDYYTNLA
ncbi:YebC/PmpR family DNA-binding transcriptional regulator [Candidatus Kuenenbacteria bacterium CG_4_9_14_3_um_filter_39_14]|uniref:Probable transcriptional regulatory protein COZ84_01755 n=6 Tax=Candidatus Kueneniibacteriota TaxID=1752740 RepID=A0A2M7ILT7_9BACT|nr:MAG: YebC/PmpR family DNA-binding transcriptional regulator [Candidatus Kuenenbacteria bacterium CG23_combo_of_CG06-09_8_20_14_all_39_39]PIR81141.1 MAG: YebC/PmpR family DNA-binding transcriptional regulator [Candidatus Kuenenbacteria bacterium CG10_big_fil_rev_8_21_14_0_10_39_14]PIW95761.1 MAG: YebC/PmpR family DNA-binding transcriptional regulator [Candidatus Kuenenbacteria bacterium CG_4_8_14_3_um_filter_39_15]PIX92591.1 MAG: YebC/PmpR family DNA-binding transcriptional regulator [Candidat